MFATLCLLGSLLAPSQTASPPVSVTPVPRATGGPVTEGWLITPQVAVGHELVYRGTFVEQAMGRHVQLQHTYQMENRVFVLDATLRGLNLAVVTLFKDETVAGWRVGDRVALKPVESTEGRSAHLECIKLDLQGRPTPQPGGSLTLPLAGPPALECGFSVPIPPGRLGVDRPWTVSEPGRPDTTWTVTGVDVVGGVSCLHLTGVQQSADWDHPRGGSAAWKRLDSVWLSPRNGMAQRVERRIEHRMPGDSDPLAFSLLRYDLQSDLQMPPVLAEDRRREIAQTAQLQQAARPLLAQPLRNGIQIDALMTKARAYLDSQARTTYREALVHLQHRLEAARRGETPPELPSAIQQDEVPNTSVRRIARGKPAPDFLTADLAHPGQAVSLRQWHGNPVLLFFFNPDSRSLDELMEVLQGVAQRHREVVLLGLTMSNDAARIARLQREKAWKMPVLNGTGLRISYDVDCIPKLVLIDADGVVQGSVVGWGSETPSELEAELKRWLHR
jgi:hypothetical protein